MKAAPIHYENPRTKERYHRYPLNWWRPYAELGYSRWGTWRYFRFAVSFEAENSYGHYAEARFGKLHAVVGISHHSNCPCCVPF